MAEKCGCGSSLVMRNRTNNTHGESPKTKNPRIMPPTTRIVHSSYVCRFSRITAMPCPPPIHAVDNPYLPLRRRSSFISVTRRRVPVAPSVCPSAMAPPFTLTLLRSSPSSFSTARYCAAKASFTSIRSMSSSFSPAFFSAMRVDGTGPEPMILGSTPAIPQLTMRAIGFRFRFSASSSGPTTHDSAGMAGGDRTVLAERRLQLAQALHRGFRPAMIVLGEHLSRRLAFAIAQRDWRYLFLQASRLVGFVGQLLRARGKFVLHLARNALLFGVELGGAGHVKAAIGVEQRHHERIDRKSTRLNSSHL